MGFSFLQEANFFSIIFFLVFVSFFHFLVKNGAINISKESTAASSPLELARESGLRMAQANLMCSCYFQGS